MSVENISFSSVSLTIGDKPILQDVSLHIQKAQIFGLIGPNGSGKSSLISVLCGLQPKFSGLITAEVVSGGVREVVPFHSKRVLPVLAVVFQSPSLDQKLTAFENLYFAATLRGHSASTGKDLASEGLKNARLLANKNQKVAEFSGGMKRRLDLARALLSKPSVLILDEPTTGLDENSSFQFWESIQDYRTSSSLTVVLATHKPDEANRCDKVALFLDGKCSKIATPAEFKRELSNDIITLSASFASLGEKLQVTKTLVDELGLTLMERFKNTELPTAVGLGSPLLAPAQENYSIELNDGHLAIPRIVNAFPKGALTSISLRQASMSDVFFKVTGASLE